MARNSSLRAQLSPMIENGYLAAAAGSVVAGAMVAAFLGPLGFLLLAFVPIDVALAAFVHRRRMRWRAEAVEIASGSGRGVAVTEEVEELGEMRGGQRLQRVRARIEPLHGMAFAAEADVFWTNADPGAEGIAAWADPKDVLLYFAEGPETPAELEEALNRETGQYSREPVLPE